jgi:hypothetical protein
MRNVLPKFSDDRPNLAVIVDDLFASPADAHAVIDGDIDKFFALTETRTLGAIVFLVPENPWGQSVRYISNFYVNPNAWTRCRLPEIAVTALADRARQDAVICNI